jgi:uncharacterized protein YkwD
MTPATCRSYFLLLVCLLPACGGGSVNNNVPTSTELRAQESGAPAITGDVASDGFNWFNYRRQQAGLPALRRNSTIDRAAAAHANYQQANNLVTHDETPGQPGYTGATSMQRLQAAGVPLNPAGFSDGEVIAASSDKDGFSAAEGLMAAIYHRFVILQPVFDEAGAGTAVRSGGYTWLDVNFIFNQPVTTQTGRLILWPYPQQKNVIVNFFSDQESPDPVPQSDEVGYPVSVHADIGATVLVDSFTIRPTGEAPLATRLLESATDTETPHSAAAIIPLLPLRAATNYDVEFIGTVDGVAVNRQWSFMTR